MVDGSTRGNPGPSKTQALHLELGVEIFNIDLGFSTNNITEFIGLVTAIYYAFELITPNVFTDSQTAISWLKKSKCNSKLTISPKTKKCHEYIKRCEDLLKTYEVTSDGIDVFISNGRMTVTVEKWLTSEWGENPADFGFKK